MTSWTFDFPGTGSVTTLRDLVIGDMTLPSPPCATAAAGMLREGHRQVRTGEIPP